jgi:hypothetical protein
VIGPRMNQRKNRPSVGEMIAMFLLMGGPCALIAYCLQPNNSDWICWGMGIGSLCVVLEWNIRSIGSYRRADVDSKKKMSVLSCVSISGVLLLSLWLVGAYLWARTSDYDRSHHECGYEQVVGESDDDGGWPP